MEYFIYDTETTGLTRSDEIIQLAGLLVDDNLNLLKAIDFYCYTQVAISKSATQVHGITSTALRKLSDGKTFEDYFYESELSKKKNLTWISFSTNGFDERMINQTLKNNGLPAYDFGPEIKYFGAEKVGVHRFNAYAFLKNRCFNGKNAKLTQMIACTPYANTLDSLFAKVFHDDAAKHLQFHDALYDSFALWVLLSHFKSRLGINGL